jgi:hypothetical protein
LFILMAMSGIFLAFAGTFIVVWMFLGIELPVMAAVVASIACSSVAIVYGVLTFPALKRACRTLTKREK